MLLDYGDGSSGDGGLMQDVDHRQMSGNLSMPSFLKEKGRLADVDHRNLISLTGSPGGPPQLKDLHELDALDDSSSSSSMPMASGMRGGMHKRKPAPQPVPAPPTVPSNDSDRGGGRGSVWAAHGNVFPVPTNDVDLRLMPPAGASSSYGVQASNSALTVVPTTDGSSEATSNDAGDESNDLDMRIQSLEKAIAAQIASSGNHSTVPPLSLDKLDDADGGSDLLEGGSAHDGEENEDSVHSVEGAAEGDGELNLPTLQTPVSLLEIDSFLVSSAMFCRWKMNDNGSHLFCSSNNVAKL